MQPTSFDRALSRAISREEVPRRIRAALALLASGRTEGAALTAAERNLRDALPRLFAYPIECEDEIATLIAQAMTVPVDFSDVRKTARLTRNRSDPGAPHAVRANPRRTP